MVVGVLCGRYCDDWCLSDPKDDRWADAQHISRDTSDLWTGASRIVVCLRDGLFYMEDHALDGAYGCVLLLYNTSERVTHVGPYIDYAVVAGNYFPASSSIHTRTVVGTNTPVT